MYYNNDDINKTIRINDTEPSSPTCGEREETENCVSPPGHVEETIQLVKLKPL